MCRFSLRLFARLTSLLPVRLLPSEEGPELSPALLEGRLKPGGSAGGFSVEFHKVSGAGHSERKREKTCTRKGHTLRVTKEEQEREISSSRAMASSMPRALRSSTSISDTASSCPDWLDCTQKTRLQAPSDRNFPHLCCETNLAQRA